MKRSNTEHEGWMKKALALARRGEGKTRPNPPVGAVLVRGRMMVGSGFHRKAGAAHAEILALRAAGGRARGATLYLTLEPCSTQGRTGPCTAAIIQAGISRVVLAVRDPNPRQRGGGVRLLRRAGIEVIEGVCANEGAELVAPFSKWVMTGIPYVTLKVGMTLDGRIADSRGKSKWITGEAARREVRAWRQKVDAVLVGGRTAFLDNPSLRAPGRSRTIAWRVIMDSSGKLPLTATVLRDGYADRTIMAVTASCSKRRQEAYLATGARVLQIPAVKGRVSPRHLCKALGKMDIMHVLCEGGSEIAYALMRARLVDQCLFFVAGCIMGGRNSLPAVTGKGWLLSQAPRFTFQECRRVGTDILLRALPQEAGRKTRRGA